MKVTPHDDGAHLRADRVWQDGSGGYLGSAKSAGVRMEQRRTSLMVRTSERVPGNARRTVTLPDQPLAELALLLFNCAKTVSESHLF